MATPAKGTLVRSRAFLAALAVLTIVPLAGLPALMLSQPAGSSPLLAMPSALTVLMVTGTMHVASTSYFYFDHAFRPVLREHPLRCWWSILLVPLALTGVGTAGLWLVGNGTVIAVVALQNAWLFYHYQRQNFGLIAFVGRYVEFGPLPPALSPALDLMALGGILCAYGVAGFVPDKDSLIPAAALGACRTAGTGIFVFATLWLLWLVLRTPRLLGHPWLLGAVVLGWAFFLPAVVFDVPGISFFPYAVAHGAQYLLMMTVVSGRSRGGWLAVIGMGTLAAGLGYLMEAMVDWKMLLASTGLVQVHFLVDARMWRLRDPQQRAIMSERFDFLLAR